MRIHAKPSLARSADMFLPTLASKASGDCAILCTPLPLVCYRGISPNMNPAARRIHIAHETGTGGACCCQKPRWTAVSGRVSNVRMDSPAVPLPPSRSRSSLLVAMSAH